MLTGRSATATSSCCSCGKTSRNHPTHPASMSTPPSMPIRALVTGPAAAKVHPKANTMGHAVTAGSGMFRSARSSPRMNCLLSIDSPSHQVHNRENHDPYRIDKVPVQREDLDALGVRSGPLDRQA